MSSDEDSPCTQTSSQTWGVSGGGDLTVLLMDMIYLNVCM